MAAGDVSAVVDVHMKAFPGFFLTFLGTGFLRELYRGIVTDPSGVAFVAESGASVVGFVAGTTEPAGFYKRLMKRRLLVFALHSAVAVLRRPSAARRLLRALARPGEASGGAAGRAELMSIAVLPSARGAGFGVRLIDAFVAGAEDRGSTAVFLTTDAIDNDAVNALYAHRGFVLSRTFSTPEGRKMNEYRKEIER
jgi:colanic acid biosynthesis glycosyl transferase WcaI